MSMHSSLPPKMAALEKSLQTIRSVIRTTRDELHKLLVSVSPFIKMVVDDDQRADLVTMHTECGTACDGMIESAEETFTEVTALLPVVDSNKAAGVTCMKLLEQVKSDFGAYLDMEEEFRDTMRDLMQQVKLQLQPQPQPVQPNAAV
jgi:hypothetical protein